MRYLVAFLACFFALALSGCSDLMQVQSEDLMGTSDMTPQYEQDPDNYICKGVASSLPCYCVFCNKESDWPSWLQYLSNFFDATLREGECAVQECSRFTYDDTLSSDDNMFIRTVSVGQGPSFTSTDVGNAFCANSLQIASKWLIGKNAPPEVPSSVRATCWLDRNILPIYMYYTEGKHIDGAKSAEIAGEFDGKGPVLLTTEVWLDSSINSRVRSVKEQIKAYDTCQKCLTVLAVNLSDKDALIKILDDPTYYTNPFDPSAPPKRLSQMVDVVGFGFRANDYESCKSEKVIGDAFAFSRYILTQYSKPTIWLYAGASEGKNVDGTCEWSTAEVRNFYQNLFALTQGMASSGILGFSLYELNDRTGPLPCNGVQGCDFGVFRYDGTQKNPAINTWSTLCRYFSDNPDILGDEKTQYRSPLVFSRNGQGGQCDFVQNTKLFNKLSSEVNPDPAFFETDPVVPDTTSIPEIRCGETCVADHPVPDSGLYDGEPTDPFNPFHCHDLSVPGSLSMIIEETADDLDISSNYYRALVEELNDGYSDILIKCVPQENVSCNPENWDMTAICQGVNDPSYPCFSYFTCTTDPPYKPCLFGFSQTKDYPGKRYPIPSNLMPEIRDCGGADYNPFNPSMSVCNGLKKFERYLLEASAFLETNWEELGRCDSDFTEDDRPWAAYFLATYLYNNESMGDASVNYAPTATLPPISEWISAFRDKNGQCTGGDDNNYIHYVRYRFSNFPSRVMSRYFSALHFCDSNCEDCCGE